MGIQQAQTVVTVTTPYMTFAEYAKLLGGTVTDRSVEGMVRAGHIKVKKKGKRVFVNVLAETLEALEQAQED